MNDDDDKFGFSDATAVDLDGRGFVDKDPKGRKQPPPMSADEVAGRDGGTIRQPPSWADDDDDGDEKTAALDLAALGLAGLKGLGESEEKTVAAGIEAFADLDPNATMAMELPPDASMAPIRPDDDGPVDSTMAMSADQIRHVASSMGRPSPIPPPIVQESEQKTMVAESPYANEPDEAEEKTMMASSPYEEPDEAEEKTMMASSPYEEPEEPEERTMVADAMPSPPAFHGGGGGGAQGEERTRVQAPLEEVEEKTQMASSGLAGLPEMPVGESTMMFDASELLKPREEVPQGVLTITGGNDVGKEFFLRGGTMVVGRGLDCDVVLNDPSVSRKHFRLEQRGQAYVMVDLGSGNGTKIDGVRVAEQELGEGHQIDIGTTTLTFGFAGSEYRAPVEVEFEVKKAGGGLKFAFFLVLIVAIGGGVFFAGEKLGWWSVIEKPEAGESQASKLVREAWAIDELALDALPQAVLDGLKDELEEAEKANAPEKEIDALKASIEKLDGKTLEALLSTLDKTITEAEEAGAPKKAVTELRESVARRRQNIVVDEARELMSKIGYDLTGDDAKDEKALAGQFAAARAKLEKALNAGADGGRIKVYERQLTTAQGHWTLLKGQKALLGLNKYGKVVANLSVITTTSPFYTYAEELREKAEGREVHAWKEQADKLLETKPDEARKYINKVLAWSKRRGVPVDQQTLDLVAELDGDDARVAAAKKPEEVAKKPEEVAKKPEEVAKKPEEIAKKPEEVAKKPEEVAKKPEEVAKKPEEVAKKPEEVAKKPEEVAKKPEVVVVAPTSKWWNFATGIRPKLKFARANLRAGYRLYGKRSFQAAAAHFENIARATKKYRKRDRTKAANLAKAIRQFASAYAAANAAVSNYRPTTAIPKLIAASNRDKAVNGTFRGDIRRKLAKMYAFQAAQAYNNKKYKKASSLARKALINNPGESSARLIKSRVESKVLSMMAEARSAKARGQGAKAERILKTVLAILPRSDPQARKARKILNDLEAARGAEGDD